MSQEDLVWLREDASFQEAIRNGWLLDLDGVANVKTEQVKEATPTGKPSGNPQAIVLQIKNLHTLDEVRQFSMHLPQLEPDDLKMVQTALAERLKEFESNEKKKSAKNL